MSSHTLSTLADIFNLFQQYHLASSTVMRQLELIETLQSLIRTINSTRKESEKISVNTDAIWVFELIREIQIIINRNEKYNDDYKRITELCQKLFGDKNESQVVGCLNNHVDVLHYLINKALTL